MAAFDRMATVSASTKRSSGIVGGLEAGYVENIASLKCTPLDPIDPNLTPGVKGLAWHETLQTFTEGNLDIVEGDLLVVATVEYPIRAVAEWTWRGVTEYKHIMVQDIK